MKSNAYRTSARGGGAAVGFSVASRMVGGLGGSEVICDPALEGLMVSVRALLLRNISYLLLLLTDVPLHAAFEFQQASAGAGGVGDNFVAWAQGLEAVFWNPGAIVWNSGIGIIGGYDRPFGVSELRLGIPSMVIPVGKVVARIRIEDFGFALYWEQVMGATLAYQVADRLGTGLAISSLRLRVQIRRIGRCSTLA